MYGLLHSDSVEIVYMYFHMYMNAYIHTYIQDLPQPRAAFATYFCISTAQGPRKLSYNHLLCLMPCAVEFHAKEGRDVCTSTYVYMRVTDRQILATRPCT